MILCVGGLHDLYSRIQQRMCGMCPGSCLFFLAYEILADICYAHRMLCILVSSGVSGKNTCAFLWISTAFMNSLPSSWMFVSLQDLFAAFGHSEM